uniref:Uncharacterized protein n=1 Tax=Rhizophora mucronata TaxID=61149 RepID=A0A2P2P8F0_RHIMU
MRSKPNNHKSLRFLFMACKITVFKFCYSGL